MSLLPESKWIRRLIACSAAAVAGAALIYQLLFPSPSAGPLPGPHAVGSLTFEIPRDGDKPALVAQVWYPTADSSGGEETRWLPDAGLAPGFPWQRLKDAKARARSGVALARNPAGKRPVIFYEHSWTGHRAENVAQVESLASRGFVIVAVDHPGQASRIRYADGEIIRTRLADDPDLSSEASVASFLKQADSCLNQRIEDIHRVKAALMAAAVPPLSNNLDFEHLGVFGFSFGGTCALRLCARDPAFVAGANQDGLHLFDDEPRGPFLFFDEEMPAWLLAAPQAGEEPGQILTRQAEARIQGALHQPGRQRHILAGTNHASFSDRIFYSRIPRLARAGKRPAAEIHANLTNALDGFFRQSLPAAD